MSDSFCGAIKAENCLSKREILYLERIAELLLEVDRRDAAIAELVAALKGCLPRSPPAACDGASAVIAKYDIPKDGL